MLGLVEIGAVELHPWNATVDDIEHADRLVFDLDPGEGVEWASVVETALVLREALRAEGLESWPKLTGGKGLHLMAPLERPVPHDAARQYARSLLQKLVEQRPHAYLLSASPAARHACNPRHAGAEHTRYAMAVERKRQQFVVLEVLRVREKRQPPSPGHIERA